MKYTLFALQVFLPMETTGALRRELHGLIRASGERETYDRKRRFYDALARNLGPFGPLFTHGVWDYLEDSSRAEAEYNQWCRGTVEDAHEASATPQHAYREGGATLMFVTMLFLLRRGGTSDRFVCEECRMPEEDFFRRETVARLITRMALLNFPSVRADAVFVRPGASDRGVSPTELGEDHYDYVKALT